MKKTNSVIQFKSSCRAFFGNWILKAILLLSVSTLLLPETSRATHFRYGHLTWQNLGNNSVRFTLVDAFRRDGYSGTNADGKPQIGDIIAEDIGPTNLSFGDGTNTPGPELEYKVIAFDIPHNWILCQALEPGSSTKTSIDHTYLTPNNGGVPWLAEINACCRTLEEINNPDGDYEVSTYVDLAGGNNSPSSSLPTIVNLPVSATASFFVPAADPDPSTYLRYRLATPGEAGSGFNQPTGITINPITGIATWNTLTALVGKLYSCQVIIEDYNSVTNVLKTSVAIDFLILITNCPAGNATPAFISPTPTNGTIIDAYENVPMTFTVKASDANINEVVNLNSGGVPNGASLSPSLPTSGNPATAVFNWTPGVGTAGTYVVTFSATDECGAQSLCSFTIRVNVCTPPSCTIGVTPCTNVYTGGVPTIIYLGYGPQCVNLNGIVTNGTATQWTWSGSYLSCTSCTSATFTPTAPGYYTITLTVKTDLGCTSTCSISICVFDVKDPAYPGKIILCHVPPGNTGNPQSLSVGPNAVPAHLSAHSGDRIGKCGQTCKPLKISDPGEIQIVNDNNELQMSVYPNPFTNGFHITVENENKASLNIRLFNMDGQTVQTLMDVRPDQDISLGENLTSGIYFMEVNQGDFKKVVIVNKVD